MPQPGPDADRLAVFAPATVFLNPAARNSWVMNPSNCRAGWRSRT